MPETLVIPIRTRLSATNELHSRRHALFFLFDDLPFVSAITERFDFNAAIQPSNAGKREPLAARVKGQHDRGSKTGPPAATSDARPCRLATSTPAKKAICCAIHTSPPRTASIPQRFPAQPLLRIKPPSLHQEYFLSIFAQRSVTTFSGNRAPKDDNNLISPRPSSLSPLNKNRDLNTTTSRNTY